MKSSDAKACKCHLKFSSIMMIFIKLVYLSSVISLKWQWRLPINCHLSEITELKCTSLIKMVILEQNFKWHLEAFASELFKYCWFNLKKWSGCLKILSSLKWKNWVWKNWFNHQKLKILCSINYLNYLSWFDKRKDLLITNHENIFLQCMCCMYCKDQTFEITKCFQCVLVLSNRLIGRTNIKVCLYNMSVYWHSHI